ncbi:hypothetical protein amrb99_34670 [Actinomadura sp. RB99]|nr:hypothetical protein [Actinomadura sp. RB99]
MRCGRTHLPLGFRQCREDSCAQPGYIGGRCLGVLQVDAEFAGTCDRDGTKPRADRCGERPLPELLPKTHSGMQELLARFHHPLRPRGRGYEFGAKAVVVPVRGVGVAWRAHPHRLLSGAAAAREMISASSSARRISACCRAVRMSSAMCAPSRRPSWPRSAAGDTSKEMGVPAPVTTTWSRPSRAPTVIRSAARDASASSYSLARSASSAATSPSEGEPSASRPSLRGEGMDGDASSSRSGVSVGGGCRRTASVTLGDGACPGGVMPHCRAVDESSLCLISSDVVGACSTLVLSNCLRGFSRAPMSWSSPFAPAVRGGRPFVRSPDYLDRDQQKLQAESKGASASPAVVVLIHVAPIYVDRSYLGGIQWAGGGARSSAQAAGPRCQDQDGNGARAARTAAGGQVAPRPGVLRPRRRAVRVLHGHQGRLADRGGGRFPAGRPGAGASGRPRSRACAAERQLAGCLLGVGLGAAGRAVRPRPGRAALAGRAGRAVRRRPQTGWGRRTPSTRTW